MTFDRIDMNALEADLIRLRRDLHRHPETAWTEFRTTALIISELEKLGLPVEFGPAIHVPEKMYGMPKEAEMQACYERALQESDRPDLIEKMKGGFTGCITEIQGELPGPTVGIRVDIDCNDCDESTAETHKPAAGGYASLHAHCMHACGHDAHTAIGIGTARLLCAYRDRLPGKVVLVFQPGEEGLRGAASLTATGRFAACDYFFGAHVGLGISQKEKLQVGDVVASTYGFLSSTKFDAVFHGKAAHAGASPDQGCNAIAAASAAVINMLAIARHHDGASRINIGTFHGGTGRNVIPDRAELGIETRGVTNEINEYMEKAAVRVLEGAAAMYGCSVETRFMGSAGGVVCDEELVEKTVAVLEKTEGVKRIIRSGDFGGGEDVTTIMRDVQAHGGQVTEMILGMPLTAPHHNGLFDVDERVIGLGARVFASLALEVSRI